MGISIQPQAAVTTAYRAEVTFGTLAANDSSARVFRPIAGQGLKLVKTLIPSQEVRSDLQGQRDTHGPRSITGSLTGELSLATFDDLFQAVMRSTWSTVLTSASFTMSSYVQSTGVLTRGTGSFLSEGYKVGDVVTLAGAGVNANIPVVLAIVTATTVTVANRTALTDATSVTGVTMVRPKKLVMGTTRRSFSVEHWAPTITNSERFVGVRVTSMTLTMPAVGPATVEFGFTGWDLVTNTVQYFTAASTTTSVNMTSPNANIFYNGGQQSSVQSVTITINLNHSTPPVAGALVSPDVVEGQAQVTGSMTMFVVSQAQLLAFVAETQLTFQLLFREAGSAGFLSIALNNVTLGDYTTERIGQNDAQMVTFPLMVGIAAGSDRDTSMATITTSAT